MSKRKVLLAVAALLIAAGSAYGQSIMAVTVPFSFFAGSRNLPAGDYTIEINHEKGTSIITVRSNGHSGNINTVVMLASSGQRITNPDKSYALFNRYGSQYFLTQVSRGGIGQTLRRGKSEREFASQANHPGVGPSGSSTLAR